MQVRDLVRKYGTELQTLVLGIRNQRALPNGNVWFVDSGKSNATDANDGEHGHSWDVPLATIDYAVGLCTPDNGDIIIVAPGHNEDLGSAQTIDVDVAGVTIIGLGTGSDRPRIDLNHSTASVDIGADNVSLYNLAFLPGAAAVAIGVDVEAGSTDVLIEDCTFMDGEDGAGEDEFVLAINAKAGADRLTVRNCEFSTHASADGATHAVLLTGASDRVTIDNCIMRGTFSTACIGGITTLSTNVLIRDCLLVPKDTEPGIEMLTGTTGCILRCFVRTNLGTIAAAIVADAMARFECYYSETGAEAGALIGTPSVDD
jgi:hypothetical protein